MMIQPTEREVELYDLIVNTNDKEKIAEYRAELKKIHTEREKDPVMIRLRQIFG